LLLAKDLAKSRNRFTSQKHPKALLFIGLIPLCRHNRSPIRQPSGQELELEMSLHLATIRGGIRCDGPRRIMQFEPFEADVQFDSRASDNVPFRIRVFQSHNLPTQSLQ